MQGNAEHAVLPALPTWFGHRCQSSRRFCASPADPQQSEDPLEGQDTLVHRWTQQKYTYLDISIQICQRPYPVEWHTDDGRQQ